MLPLRILILIFAIMMQGIFASEQEDVEETASKDTNVNDADDRSNELVKRSKVKGNLNPAPAPLGQTQVKPDSSQLRLKQENGALFNTVPSYPVMDSEGRVTTVPFQAPQPQQQSQFMSSENTVSFPSILGKRPRGLPTHADLIDPATEYYKRYRSLEPSQNLNSVILTEDIDQGPLSPAPKSLMELAGWWEYLAILFGEAGDSTALRLILHRLSKLAQLQLQGDEAIKVQAATAFLSSHFERLLLDSFRQFVNDPGYTVRSTTWSNDPGFSNIVRKLVDQMDYFGAQEDLERIFGPNTNVAVSFGMRQPEWLRLKLIIEQIAWDLRHPNDLIGLWSSSWKLSVAQKLSILAYASNPRVSAPLNLNLPNRDLILARINLITNGEAPKNRDQIKNEETQLDQAHYHYALLQANGNLCARGDQTNLTTPASSSNIPTSKESDGFKRRVEDYCQVINLTPNFSQFCQTGPRYSTPLSALLAAAGDLFDKRVIKYVNHLERLYWAFTWVGACQEAHEIVVTLTNQIKTLGPRGSALKLNKRVPSGVSESIQIRLEYMQAVQQTCQTNLQLTGSADVAHIFTLLNYKHTDEALREWERRYSRVAARLQGYPGETEFVSNPLLLYQQARDVRIALLIYKYPKSIYVPCLSRGLLTRDPATDLTLLNLAHSLSSRKSTPTRIDPLLSGLSARSLYMRALYLAGRHPEAVREARELAATGGDSGLVKEFLACSLLCGSTTRNPCEAEKTYNQLISGASGSINENISGTSRTGNSAKIKSKTSEIVYRVGKELSTRLCRLSRNTASDALSLRYGKVLTTQATFAAFNRVIGGLNEHGLRAGEAESVLPWFGSLPPAPVDEILSFVPTTKLNFAPQVGINGIPVIKSSDSSGNTGTTTATANSNILVLGKEYPANLLTESTAASSSESASSVTQPKIKIKNGYFQFEKSDGKSSQEGTQRESEGQREQREREDEE